MNTKFYLGIILSGLMLLLSSCGSSSKAIRIESNPLGANVLAIQADGQQVSIGKTPIQISEDELFKGGKLVQLQTTLAGYKDTNVYIPKSDRLREASLSIIMKEQISSETKNSEKLNILIGEIVLAQSLILQKKWTQAEGLLQKLAREYPSIAVIRDLLGNSLYLNNKPREALDVYLKAEALDPNNNMRKGIINKIKGL